MLNRNMANYFLIGPFTTTTYAKLKSIENSVVNISPSGTSSYIKNISTKKKDELTTNLATFTIGSGTTEETFEDIALGAPIDETNFSIISGTRAFTDDYDNTKAILTQVWQYLGTDEITINEIGYIARFGSTDIFMFDHTVLDIPITVNNGDTFTIALTIGSKATAIVNQ